MALFARIAPGRRASTINTRSRLSVEALESRLTPYALSGNAWIRPELITISFVPDGTVLGTNANGSNIASNLQATFNAKFGSAAVWQNQILRAAQTWAAQTNINFRVVGDNGAAIGSGNNQQGDANYGDIRIGGYNFGTTTLAQSYLPPPDNGTSYAGDMQFNTGQTFNSGSTYDLYTVALHEFGHGLGLYHGNNGTAMYGSYNGVVTSLTADDISGIRAVAPWSVNGFSSAGYGGARAKDSYDNAATNGTSTTASDVSATINTTSKTALLQNLDLTATTDVDYYKFTVPTGLGGNVTVKAVSQGLSLLAPTLTLYDSGQAQLATQSGLNQYGTTLTVTASVTAGQTYYVKVQGVDTTAFSTGKYALTLAFAGVASPSVPLPTTTTANDPDSIPGGGQAVGLGPETGVAPLTYWQSYLTMHRAARAVAVDAQGNSVVTWSSDKEGNQHGVYAQRFDADGNPLGSEFLVNTTTANNQSEPAVAMDGAGNFVIVWVSNYQDGSGKGVYGRRYGADGTPLSGEFRVNSTTAYDQCEPLIAMNATGQFVVTYTSFTSTGYKDVYVRRYDASGSAQGNAVLVNNTTAGDQNAPSVGIDATGNFVVAWHSYAPGVYTGDIYARGYNAAGTAQSNEFRVNTYTADDQSYPDVGMAANGTFVIAWGSYGQDGSNSGVYARRFGGTGVAQGGEFRVNTTTAGSQSHASVAMNSGGNFFITWESYGQDATNSGGVYGQQFNPSGAPQGLEFRVNTTTAGNQGAPSMAMNSNGNAVVVWMTDAQVGGAYRKGVNMQRYMVSYGGMNPMHGFDADGHDHEGEDRTSSRPTARRGYAVSQGGPLADLSGVLGLLRRRGNGDHRSETSV